MANEDSKKVVVEEKKTVETVVDTKAEKSSSTQNSNSDSENKNDRSSSGQDGRRNRRRSFRGRRRSYVPYAVLLREHEEAMKSKKVVDNKVTGTVKWFSMRYHYGFIARDDGKGDVFVHQMNIIKSRMNKVYMRSLASDEKVEFDVVEGQRGPEAANVTGPDGVNVRGVYILRIHVPSNRRPNNRRNSSARRQRRRSENKTTSGAEDSSTENTTGNKQDPPRANRRRRNTNNKKNNKAGNKAIDQVVEGIGNVKVSN